MALAQSRCGLALSLRETRSGREAPGEGECVAMNELKPLLRPHPRLSLRERGWAETVLGLFKQYR